MAEIADQRATPVDLRTLGGPEAQPADDQAPPRPPETAPYDPGRDRETTRGRIALNLVRTLIGLVAATFGLAIVLTWVCNGPACSDPAKNMELVRTLVQLLLTPIVGLVGAVIGFYFGAHSTKGS